MESRLGGRCRPGAQPPRGPHRRCGGGGDGDGVDRISGLNDDLLIQVLVRLRSAAAAARTSVLSRRWRGLWRHLPELSFRRVAPDALQVALAQNSATHTRNLQEMFQLPNISVLELKVKTCAHVWEAMVLNLLRICNATRKLKVAIDHRAILKRNGDETCPPDCPCNEPQNWRSQNVSLSLQEVEIVNFKGSSHEVDFLKLLFRCAPLMNVTLRLASKVSPRSQGCKETYKIFKANPAAECHVYRIGGKEVIYA